MLKAIGARYAEHEPMEMNECELRLVADVMIDRIGHDGRTRLAKLFGEREVKRLPNTALVGFIVQCAVIGEVHVPGYATIGKPEKLLTLAESLDLDPAAIKREVQKSLKTAKKPAKKATPPPSDAAPAADKRATDPDQKDQATPRLKKPAAKTAKAKASPVPASPGNEAAAPPTPVASVVATKDDWPFPAEARIG